MNSLERVSATLSGNPFDRRPVSITLSLYGARLTNCPLATYYSDADEYFRGQEAIYETFQPDILFGPFAIPLYGRAFGSEIRFYESQPPNLRKPVLHSPAQFESISLPDPDTDSSLLYMRRSIRLMAERYGESVPIAAVALDPISLPIMIMGLDNWLQTFLFDVNLAEDILARLQTFFTDWVNILFAEGASFVVLPTAFTTPAIIPRNIVAERCLPILEKSFSTVKGPLVLHATGAPLSPFIDLFTSLANVAGFVLNDTDSLSQARHKAGQTTPLIGNLEGPECNRLSVEQMRQKCESILQDRRDDPYFILGTSGADIPFDTDPGCIHAIRQSAEEFGA